VRFVGLKANVGLSTKY